MLYQLIKGGGIDPSKCISAGKSWKPVPGTINWECTTLKKISTMNETDPPLLKAQKLRILI